MLPALERKIQLVTEKEVLRRLEAKVRRSLGSRDIPESIYHAFFSVSRIDVLRYYFRVFDTQRTFPTSQIDKIIAYALRGDQLPVHYDTHHDTFLTTTSLPLMIHMTALAQPRPSYEGKRVLVVGSGTGMVPLALMRLGANLTGIEINTDMVRLSNELILQRKAYGVTIVHANAVEWIVGQGLFDAMLGFAAAPYDVVDRFLDHLMPGGKLVFPIGEPDNAWLTRMILESDGNQVTEDRVTEVTFVPFVLPEDIA